MSSNILYISGYGRSGSTILDLSLAWHPQVASGGEIFRAAEIFSDPEAQCTCGVPLAECPVWGPVRRRYEDRARAFGGLMKMQEAFAAHEGMPGLKAYRRAGPSDGGELGQIWTELNLLAFQALSDNAGPGSWIVDSSKTARGASARPLLLSRLPGTTLKILPLARSVPGVLASARKGSNRAMEAGKSHRDPLFVARSLIGWLLANASSRRVASSLAPEQTLQEIWYEDFRRAPADRIAAILGDLGLDAAERMKPVDTSGIHMIGGNRTRFSSTDVVQADLPTGDLATRLANLTVSGILKTGIV